MLLSLPPFFHFSIFPSRAHSQWISHSIVATVTWINYRAHVKFACQKKRSTWFCYLARTFNMSNPIDSEKHTALLFHLISIQFRFCCCFIIVAGYFSTFLSLCDNISEPKQNELCMEKNWELVLKKMLSLLLPPPWICFLFCLWFVIFSSIDTLLCVQNGGER